MATSIEPVELNFPELPSRHDQFLQYVSDHPKKPMLELLEPYKQYDAELRRAFAQQPDHPAVKEPNVLPLFDGHEKHVTVRARNTKAETERQRDCYIMPLKPEDRKPDGAPAIVRSSQEFRTNFNVFSESSLVDMEWSNVVVAGSAVVTSLLAVPEKHAKSKRALRQYYHEQLAPASDVDLFLYDLTEEQAIEKIGQIERNVRDALLVETTTVRTKNAITIASKHPIRHVQIVLRIYKSISEILTGFDVDCSCAAYDGKQVYVSPRALASYMTQINTVDLTRRSPSYENRLSKYAHRGFEVYWPNLDRSRIDPTIFERSFGRTEGLARLLVLEKLPKSEDRDSYLDQRRAERGRPPVNRNRFRDGMLYGNIKDEHEDEVAEWVDLEEVSDYHTVTVPYGPKFNASKVERLLFTKDLLLNAEWNKPKDREVNLHRHPAFFGSIEDVIHDCCGYCPQPSTVEEEEVTEEESKKFIKGDLTFIKDDPGRQTIGSFNPLTADDWTDMAYVGNTVRLCQAIIDEDVEYVKSWLAQEGNNPNTRDYTGRTPLHLAVVDSSIEVVQALIDHGARMVARLVDGRTALHLAAMRGNVDMVSALLRKSEANEEENEKKVDARRAARNAAKDGTAGDVTIQNIDRSRDASADVDEYSDVDMIDDSGVESDTNMIDATTEGSMVKIRKPREESCDVLANEENEDEPDVYDVNVIAWDTAVTPLHLAICQGHVHVVKCLVQDFGADVLLPIKLFNDHDKSARAAILTLVLAMQLGFERAQEMVKTLISLGASTAQADMDRKTVLQYCVADRPDMLETLGEADLTGVKRAINYLAAYSHRYRPHITSPLITAIQARDILAAVRLLALGAKSEIDFPAYIGALAAKQQISDTDSKRNNEVFQERMEQPVFTAIKNELPELAKRLVIEHGIDANTPSNEGREILNNVSRSEYQTGTTLFDVVRDKIKSLRDYKFKPNIPKAPVPLKEDDSEYLVDFKQGTYAYFSARCQVEQARRMYGAELESYEKDMKEAKWNKGATEKQDAINRLISEYEELKDALLRKGAKSFYELHPEIGQPSPRSRHGRYSFDTPESGEFTVSFDFKLGDLTDELRARYLRLFEAAWAGDLGTLKNLTLNSWKDENGDDQAPMKVAVQDDDNFSPFAIAVLQGHREVATAVMEIAQVQLVMPDPPKQRRYGIEDDEDDGSDDDRHDDVQVYSEVVDDIFTKEDVGEVSLQVKSRVLPSTMLEWDFNPVDWGSEPAPSPEQEKSNGFSYFGPRKPYTPANKRTNTGSIKLPLDTLSSSYDTKAIGTPSNLLQLAMYNNDAGLLKFLLKLAQMYCHKATAACGGEQPTTTFFELSVRDYNYALEVGRVHLFMELVKHSGAGLPLDELIEKHGIEMKQKPRYYQGLTVHGKKRKDWATRDGDIKAPSSKQTPPLLRTIDFSSLELAEWWLSDAPLRCYRDFAEANKEDKRISRLQVSEIGFEGAAQKFLTVRSHLAVHCAVMATPTVESIKMLRYMLEVMPDGLEAKNRQGLQPLQVAFETYHEGAAKLLIEAGADQMCRDNSGKNLVHSLLDRTFTNSKGIEKFKSMLRLIDKRLIPELFLQRSGSLTPLAYWMNSIRYHDDGQVAARTLNTILSYSGGQELGFINGEGDTPLHYAVKNHLLALVEVLLAHDPTFLNRENATGRTPYEIAEDVEVASVCTDPPPMPDFYQYETRRAQRYGLSDHWQRDVLDKDEEKFAEGQEVAKPHNRHKIWKTLCGVRAKLIEEGKAKRRLVTLNEANEVARRLAAMKTTETGTDLGSANGEEDLATGDEVQMWLNGAKRWSDDDDEENNEDE